MPDTTCEDYNDPKADIVLKSNTNVLFRIHSYYLKAHSSVFRDMLELPRLASEPMTDHIPTDSSKSDITPLDTTDTDTPIDIDAPTEAIHDLLDLMTRPLLVELRTRQDYSALLSLCDKFECQIAIDRIIHLLDGYAVQYPWAAFCIADRYKYLPLARQAIKHMNHHNSNNSWENRLRMSDINVARSKEVSIEYFLGLIKVLSNPHNRTDYHIIADQFQPAT